jgi:glyoxylase-like metal-dependent hydrolase (beta-lactamase superfamily II)
MSASPHRRDVLKRASAAAALAGPLSACGRGAQTSLVVTPLAEDLVMIAGAGGNVVAARGPEGALMVDAGDGAHAEELLRTVTKELGARRIATLVNTHWHLEQTGGNALVGRQGGRIIAHENTRLWMGTTIYRRWEEKTYPPAPEEARPTEGLRGETGLALGDRRVVCGYVRWAHTDGDLTVTFPDADVIAAGGIVSGQGWPIIDWSTGGWLGGMVDGIQALIDVSGEATRIVPGNGPVLGRADLERQLAMYTTILDRMREHLYASHGPEEVAASKPTAEFDAEMGDPTQFVALAFESLWGRLRMDRRVSSF